MGWDGNKAALLSVAGVDNLAANRGGPLVLEMPELAFGWINLSSEAFGIAVAGKRQARRRASLSYPNGPPVRLRSENRAIFSREARTNYQNSSRQFDDPVPLQDRVRRCRP